MLIINGEVSNDEKIIFDSGYSFGRGVFETILVKEKPLFIEEHCKRMRNALSKLGIYNSVNEEYIMGHIEKHKIKNCVLKVIATEKNTILSSRQITYRQQDYERGFNIKLSSIKRNPHSHVVYLKTLNFTDNMLEKEIATREGYDEAIFFNTNDRLAEGCVSNIFFVKDGKIFTPAISCGILDGIVRKWITENFEVYEGEFSLENVLKSEEVFLTNSIMGIMKVATLNRTCIFTQSDIAYELRNAYENFINING